MSAFLGSFETYVETVALVLSGAAAGLGLIAFVAVVFFWTRVASRYKEAWAKGAVAGFRAVAALIAIATRLAPTVPGKPFYEQPWAVTTIVAVVGYLLWEVTGVIGDHRYKSAKEKTAEDFQAQIDEANQDREDAKFQVMRFGWLLTHLRAIVNTKLQRVRRVAQTLGERVTIQHARDGLAPNEQIQLLLEWLASLFRMHVVFKNGNRHNQNFRIGLVAEHDGG